MSKDRVTVELRLQDAARFYAEAKLAAKGIDDIGDSAKKADRKSRNLGGGLNIVQRTIGLVKPAALIAGVGLLTQVLSASAAGTIGLTAALAPLAGAIGALPGAVLLAGQSMGVLAFGVMGVTDALGGLNQEINPDKFFLLQRPAQELVLTLQDMKAPLRELQADLQAAAFPGFVAGLTAAMPAVKALHAPLVDTARVAGQFGDQLGHLVGSKGFLTDLHDQAAFNNRQLRVLSAAGLDVVGVLRDLTVGSRGLIAYVVQLGAGWAHSAAQTVHAARQNGHLAEGFHTVQVTIGRVVRIGGDLVATLFNIGRIGKRELGDSLLVSLVHGADALHKWSDSATGVRQITRYFRDAKPVVYATANLFKALALEFLKMGAGGPGAAAMIDKFTALVPVLGDVVRDTTAAFGPHLVDMLTAVARAFAPLTGGSGPLALYVDGLRLAAEGVLFLEEHVPGFNGALSALLVTMAGVKTVQTLGGAFGGVATSIGLAKRGIDAFSRTSVGTTIGVKLLDALDLLKLKFLGVRDAAAEATVAEEAATGNVGKGGKLSKIRALGKGLLGASVVAGAVIGGEHLVDKYIKDGTHQPRTRPERDRATDITRGETGAVGGAVNRMPAPVSAFLGALNQVLGGLAGIAGARATGGPVTAGSRYLVGEHGPELFEATQSGTITSNAVLKSMVAPTMPASYGALRSPLAAAAPVEAAKSAPGTGDHRPLEVHSHLHAQLVLQDGTVIADLVDEAVGRSMARE